MAHENETKFTNWEFKSLLDTCEIETNTTDLKYPKSNVILETINWTIGEILRTDDFNVFIGSRKYLL